MRYNAINAMLLNEFLKEHCKVEEQERKIQEEEATVAELKNAVEKLAVRLKEQDSKIQKVNERFELTGTALQVVASDR